MIEIAKAEEVFATAVAMEEVAQAFYEALGLGSNDPKVRQFCLAAAKAEAGHVEVFRRLRQDWVVRRGRLARVADEAVEQLRSTVKGFVLPTREAVQRVALGGDRKAALELAIQMETDSIGFYQGILARLADLAPVLQPIIAEESRHLNCLLSFGKSI